jgi:hypothetical protein
LNETYLLSGELREFLSGTMAYGLELTKVAHPIQPAVAICQGGEVECNLMVDATGGDGMDVSEAFIAELPAQAQMYAFIRGGQVSVNGEKRCVLIVDAEERGMPHSVRYMQRFSPKGFLRGFKVLSDPYAAGNGPRRFK